LQKVGYIKTGRDEKNIDMHVNVVWIPAVELCCGGAQLKVKYEYVMQIYQL